jgi:hypothetical protein
MLVQIDVIDGPRLLSLSDYVMSGASLLMKMEKVGRQALGTKRPTFPSGIAGLFFVYRSGEAEISSASPDSG